MFRAIKLLFGFAALIGFAWFGVMVKLGDRTLFQHFAAIGQSRESQELVRGTKEKIGEVERQIGRDKVVEKVDKVDKVKDQGALPAPDKAPAHEGTKATESAHGAADPTNGVGGRRTPHGKSAASKTPTAKAPQRVPPKDPASDLKAGRRAVAPQEQLTKADRSDMRKLLDSTHAPH